MTDANALARRWLDALPTDPAIHIHRFDPQQRTAVLARLDADAVRAAAFLDDRALPPGAEALTVPLEAAVEAAGRIAPRPHDAIFHVARCGSTLVSRLIGELPGDEQKREPLTWLDCGRMARLAGGSVTPRAFLALFEMTARSLARPFDPDARVVVKSTSVAASLMQAHLNREPSQRALMLTLPLERWLAGVIGDDSARVNVEYYAPTWAGDVHFRRPDLGLPQRQFRVGELLALGWCGPMLWAGAAQRFAAERVLLVDVDRLLGAPAEGLAEVARFLGLAASAAQVQAVVDGDLLRHYSKDPSEPFDRAARDARVEAARREHADEIAAGLRFAEQLAADEPLIAAHLR